MDRVIQIVEDDADIRFIVEYVLEDASFKVESFESAKAFLNRSNKENVDLVILDVMLPDGSGIDLSKTMKEGSDTRSIPIIIMSAHAPSDIAISEGSADGFIQKPFDIDHFVKQVNQFIRSRE
jgi:two-component system phosphate regulon response regulator PhoB